MLFIQCSTDYAKGVRDDSNRNFDSKKKFINELHFVGKVLEKKYCPSCKIYKYQLVIDLLAFEKGLVQLPNLSFEPYYSFNDDKLTLSVSNHTYQQAETGDEVEKAALSNKIIISDQNLVLLDEDTNKWLPE